jgi:FkbM family methyltransferase
MKKIINNVLEKINQNIIRYDKLQALREALREIKSDAESEFADLLDCTLVNPLESRAQLKQDLFVLHELGYKKNGFFVDFGATNGLDLSNSYLLEKKFGWNGILAEPAKLWHGDLRKNRNVSIETRCVWKDSVSSITFNEAAAPEYSTVDSYSGLDFHSKLRKKGKKYEVESISLVDLLKKYGAPDIIDYLSIDTEGTEFEILSNFDFDAYKFRVITVEHNFMSARGKIFKLLSDNGYIRKNIALSDFDDWYVLKRD